MALAGRFAARKGAAIFESAVGPAELQQAGISVSLANLGPRGLAAFIREERPTAPYRPPPGPPTDWLAEVSEWVRRQEGRVFWAAIGVAAVYVLGHRFGRTGV